MGARAWTRVAAVGAAALALGGCGSVYIGADGPDPATEPMMCEQRSGDPSGIHVLLAQAVPTASAVPCLTTTVGDWIVTAVDVRDGRGRIEFNYRFGDDDVATVDLTADCDVGGAREVASRFDGMRRYNRQQARAGRYADEIYYVYPGGCTRLRFNISGSGADLRGAEVGGALGFISRETIDRQVREASDGQLHLQGRGSARVAQPPRGVGADPDDG